MVLFWPETVTRSYSRLGHVPGRWTVLPSAMILTKPTGAGWIVNWPCKSDFVVTAGGRPPLCCAGTFWRYARMVAPGTGLLLLSSTTPVIFVAAGLPGT